MKRATLGISVVLVLGLVGILDAQHGRPGSSQGSFAKSRYTKGRAVLREMSFDFGKVPQDSRVRKKFYLINEGVDTLEIVDIKPG